jgi:diguanylate cyclase (GGDEF)-like protein
MVKEELADVLSEFARTMVTDFPIQGILDHLVKRIVEVMPITAAGVTLISAAQDPHYVAASNGSALRYERLQTELGEGPCLAAYRTGQAISVPDLNDEDRFPLFGPYALTAGLAAVFTFPLRHDDLLLGALDLYRDTAGPLLADSMSAAQTLADVAAAYLINAQARSDLQDSSDQSHEAAMHDPLTGLPNRTLLMQRLEHAFLRVARSGKTMAVFFVDLDAFKAINDTYGHQVGDELLVAVGQRLAGVLRPGDSLARLAGDEFVVLCEDLDDATQADTIAARFGTALAQPFALTHAELNIRSSIGIAFNTGSDSAADELINDADLAMYRIKRTRGSRPEDLDLRASHLADYQAGLAAGLQGASGRGELHVSYQPIVDTANGRLTSVEALLRWAHPSRGPVSPAVFIPFAEHSGQITELGQWVLEQACRDRQNWQCDEADEIAMSVNVSAHQFMCAGFVASVASVLDATSMPPRLLTLEVTETVFVRDRERALIVLDELKATGVNLALDDFGTGYSSLGYLQKLPIDIIKIDQSFITNLDGTPAGHAILIAIIQLAHTLGMTVVSEGVETCDQYEQLATLGSDCCQGFYFAHPMPAASIERLLHVDNGNNLHLPLVRMPLDPDRRGDD